MKILIDQSGYHLKNLGDVAMLQATVARLSSLWPSASIQVLTTDPERLNFCCPQTKPLLPSGRQIWFLPLSTRAYKFIPNKLASNLESQLRDYSPSLVRSMIEFKLRKIPKQAQEFEIFMQSIDDADLVIASGGGYITDSFENHAISVLETLRLATKFGKPTAMLGQGVGPVANPRILNQAKKVLFSVDVIGLREQKAGMPLLKSMGIPHNKITVTGDDAIELAYKARREELGNGIGVNLRYANYSGISQEVFETVRSALHHVAHHKGVPLIPTPISFYGLERNGYYEEPDSVSIQKLLQGYDDDSDGGESLDNVSKLIQQVGCCRVVVTGSYHAGVFALSQGIPVIGLAKSEYYLNKFLGLADQFGVGCEVILLKGQQLREKLVNSISTAYDLSEKFRPQLLAAAQTQVQLGQMAYKQIYELV